jgi:uncharacterized protein (DUF433 family)
MTNLETYIIECVANESLSKSIDIDPEIRGGVPVLHGTRFTVSQALAELADTSCLTDFAENFDIDVEVVKNMLVGLSLLFQRPCDRTIPFSW